MSKPGFCRRNELMSYEVMLSRQNVTLAYLCFHALSIQSYADQKKLLYSTYAKS